MSVTWYECKVKYAKFDEASGLRKLKTEPFLVDAVSYTEAEKRITEEMRPFLNEGEGMLITNIKVANFAEIHPFENADRWFKVKVALIAFDENSGKERKMNQYLLVQANDIKEAFENTTHAMRDTMGEYSVPAITESPIMDVFPYFTGEEENDARVEEFNRLKESVPSYQDEDEALALEDSLTE
ncbi:MULTISPECIES: DUF4494 domain-containing protein [unclassified Leeuwenhoekiella]|uniref:DUF4494 domain-containing protein n=1 Tax=unclassified Leeuwenhoekiella TaxID=2615029 RepID=UPI000C64BA17|nr:MULTISPECIES: DUF4494 domain-containing protein [unclassified Leeuwenhoekiella]MAW95299.1 hypothetical protein [Leeuwenhoekiella sp.]MBA81778.1 hypothetical protein [Leeuwenhoekiella sp.]|tara:strand:- start:5203 stop:5754 length:552 start_codon:yes stop_codon:yes gene_type:complete